MRKHWIDNLRWVTVLLVLLYHVIYFYNNKGVFGGIGGFGDGPQYQDALMYILYPWFMPLLFLLAGVSAKYSLTPRPTLPEKEEESHPAPARNGDGDEAAGTPTSPWAKWFRARTRKLLVPATIGLFVFQWMTGYFNTAVAGTQASSPAVQGVAKYFFYVVSGIGPLWFIQDLWLFSLVLVVVRFHCSHLRLADVFLRWIEKGMKRGDKEERRSERANDKLSLLWIIMLGVLFWLGEQTLIFNPRPESLDGLWNLYKPLFYIIPFLLGYFIFWRDGVQELLGRYWIPLMAAAVVSGVALIILTFGQNNTTPQYLASPLNCIYGWLMCLAMMGLFKAKFDRTGLFATYMTHSSFGLYIVHYLVIASLGYMMKVYTQLPPVAMYLILTAAVFTLSPLLYEGLHRIPFLRWCIFGDIRRSQLMNN